MTSWLRGKRAVVVGLGKSGLAAARLLIRNGAEVVGTDQAESSMMRDALTAIGARAFLGGHDSVDFQAADLIVVSPGVPSFEALELAQRIGTEVISEVELASRFLRCPIVAIGGTNGKSTTTTLIGNLLEAAGIRAFVGGNLGEPACDAPEQDPEVVVLEVSSFQMERVLSFRPKVGLLLNITEDHLDRYASFYDYARAKGNCFAAQRLGDVALVPVDDAICLEQATRGLGEVRMVGPKGAYEVIYDRSEVLVVERKTRETFSLGEADLHGRHNHQNAAFAVAAVRALGVTADAVAEGLRRFVPLPHRMALAGRLGGVSFYDDSKATNVGAALTALLGLTETQGVMILGGRDKLGSYEPLVEALLDKGRAVVTLGEAAPRIEAALGARVPWERARNIDEAVELAFRLAQVGDAVLLSPACSSLDMFKNYAERGERFIEAVRALRRRVESSNR